MTVSEALGQWEVVVNAHMHYEGIAYLKIIRSGAQECFAADVTSQILGTKVVTGKSADERMGEEWKR